MCFLTGSGRPALCGQTLVFSIAVIEVMLVYWHCLFVCTLEVSEYFHSTNVAHLKNLNHAMLNGYDGSSICSCFIIGLLARLLLGT